MTARMMPSRIADRIVLVVAERRFYRVRRQRGAGELNDLVLQGERSDVRERALTFLNRIRETLIAEALHVRDREVERVGLELPLRVVGLEPMTVALWPGERTVFGMRNRSCRHRLCNGT